MESETRNQRTYREQTGRKRRRRRKRQPSCTIASVFLAGAVFLGLGFACWQGARFLWSGLEGMLDGLTQQIPVLSIISREPAETEIPDRAAPVLSGIHDFTIYQGDTIAYMQDVSAEDDRDETPTITVDSSGVDLSRPGSYRAIYTATDASGNASREEALVTVLEKLEGYADLDTIFQAADAKLAEIIRENATQEQQIHDVYAWARTHLYYGGHSDRADWRQTAYGMLTEGRGDCYGYWAVTKLLFERLGIQNQDVRKVKNTPDDSDHFWSLVSLDGGSTWYHFDATPRYGDGDDFCLVTDAFLDAYSDSHKGSHNRDKSLYPETP